MAWFLNNSLDSWRAAINKAYPNRKKNSDGTIGDAAHRRSKSDHNPDYDGSVDAYDMDVNLLGSNDADGNSAEDKEVEKLKAEFQKQPWAQLWIHNGQIANRDIDNWKRRKYTGSNRHTQHVHWQSRQAKERLKYEGELTENDTVMDAPNTQPAAYRPKSPKAPAWPLGKSRMNDYFKPYLRSVPPFYKTVYRWQQQMRKRGWNITVDGRFGAQTLKVLKAFQKQKKLGVDGLLGPASWAAAWEAPITDD